jgi:hypothetical protein
MTDPVFSRRALVLFQPEGSPRTYTLAPLTYLQRQAYRADLARTGGAFPGQAQVVAAIRAAVRETAPANALDLLAVVDAYEATPDDADSAARLAALESAIATVPVYAELVAARQRHLDAMPWVAARHALRGWEGDGLPPFRAARGVVPDDLLEQLPEAEIIAAGWRAVELMKPGPAAVGNSVPPSPSSQTPETIPEA